MLENWKQKIIAVVESVHRWFFGHEMSDEMRKFLKNLSWSFFGGIIASGVMLILTILAGKKLGPEGFGQYNSLLSFATALSFLFLLGSDTGSVRYLSDKSYQKDKGKILTTSLVIVLIQSILFGLIVYVFSDFIIKSFSLNKNILIFGMMLSFILAVKSLTDGYLRSFHLIKRQGIIRILDAFISISSFLLFYYILNKIIYHFYAVAILCGAIFFIIVSLITLRKNFGKISFRSAKVLFRYNKFLLIGSVGGIIISLEKYFIGRYLGIYELGIYSAYYAASFLIISNLGSIFMNVFWPSTIKEKESMKIIAQKLDVLFLKTFPCWIIFSVSFVSLLIIFLGKDYPFNLTYVFLISVSSFLAFVFSTFLSLLNIDRIKEAVVISFSCYVFLILSIIVFKNIYGYLISQIFLYLVFYLIIKKRLTIDF